MKVVVPGSLAEEAGLYVGMAVLAINGTPVTTPKIGADLLRDAVGEVPAERWVLSETSGLSEQEAQSGRRSQRRPHRPRIPPPPPLRRELTRCATAPRQYGGAIFSSGNCTLSGCTLSSNIAESV